MDHKIIKACLVSRSDYQVISAYIDVNKYQKELKYVLGFIDEYYRRDSDAKQVDLSLLKAFIAEVIDNEKHIVRFHELLDSANAVETSASNVTALVIAAKQHEVKISLATALANDEPPEKVDPLVEQYNQLRAASTLSDLEEGEAAEILENIDIDQLNQSRLGKGGMLQLYPMSLNNRIDGGMEGGDHAVLFGVTEIGKSAFSINAACGFAYQDAPGLYIINEDKTSRIGQRIVSCLSGMNKYDVMNDPGRAQALANKRGLRNIRVIGLTPGSVRQVEALVKKYKPKWLIVDQLRNLLTGTKNNRVVQLEEAATGVRNILKEHEVVGISVTQAGDSGQNKIFLEVGDVDFSNVGIPAQADLMIGVGADEKLKATNTRGISLPKNKLSGNHAQFYTQIVPTLSQVRDVGT